MRLSEFDLDEASRILGIANTPLFLVRKLQNDGSVRAIGDAIPGPEIVSELQAMITIEPTDPIEAVRPYVYLVSLWFKSEVDSLQEAARFTSSIYGWYSYIAKALLESFSPIQRQTMSIAQIPSDSWGPQTSTTAPTQAATIIIAS
jgi:hypothetical protein